MERKNIHAIAYGDSGVGKSTFAATFPKPMLVFCWDPYGKDLPYQKGAQSVSDLLTYEIPGGTGVMSITYRDIVFEDGNFTRVEYYHD